MNSNDGHSRHEPDGHYHIPELRHIPKSRRESEPHYFVIKESRLTAADIMKIIYIICGTVIISLLIVCAYKAGAVIMLVGIIGILTLAWIMGI